MMTTEEVSFVKAARETVRAHKDRIKRLRVFTEGRQTEFWEALKAEMDLSIKANETDRDRLFFQDEAEPGKSWAEVKARAWASRAHRGLIQTVEEAEMRVSATNSKIEELNKRIAEIESGTRTKHTKGVV